MTHVFAGEEPPPNRAVGDDCCTKLARGLEQPDLLIFNIERKRRVFDLQSRDGVHSVGAPECLGGALGEPEVLDLSLPVNDVH